MKYLKRENQGRAEDFRNIIRTVSSLTPLNALTYIMDKGYENYMEENRYDFGKVELLKILAKKEPTISSFLKRLQYLETQMQEGFDTKSATPVILTTIHSSKGLEYDVVYMVDVYDGRFPSSRPNIFSKSKDNADGEQEERRLFYVGITRAKNSLNLFSISGRQSSYVEELFPEIQEKIESQKLLDAAAAQQALSELFRQQQEAREKEAARRLAESEARKKEIEEKQKKEAEERTKQKELADKRIRDEIIAIIDQQEYPARDSYGRRWVRCEECDKIDLEREFSTYGGANHVNLGICSACMRKKR
jgi:ATP-dependent exoDNAse (exonuclease V) beta subunit